MPPASRRCRPANTWRMNITLADPPSRERQGSLSSLVGQKHSLSTSLAEAAFGRILFPASLMQVGQSGHSKFIWSYQQ
jgi:hypothetical protein